MKLRLATRGSRLAWTQSGLVADLLRAAGHEVDLVKVTTHGDVTSAPLASLGGAGVFVGAVRAAVLAGEADFAVHSFKDLPTAPADGLVLAAVPPREAPADALCSRGGLGLAELPTGARVGTGSPRRAAQLLARRPDLEIVEIRGNVETRLHRIQTDLDAVVLAAAGLRRLGLAAAISQQFDPDDILPAPAQGALAIECRFDDVEVRAVLAGLDDPATRLAAVAERAVLAGLQAGCAAPVAAHAQLVDGSLLLTATVVAADGSRRLTEAGSAVHADADGATALGAGIAEKLLAAGAATVVELGATKPKPLAGRRLLLPERAPAGLADSLATAGAELVTAAFTRTEPLGTDLVAAALARDWDWVVVTSAATVRLLGEQGFDLADRLGGVKIAAVGAATAAALRRAGLEPQLVARPGGGAALAEAFGSGPGRVLLPGAEDASAQPRAGLIAKGWTVELVPVYRTVALPLPEEIRTQWPAFDAFIVTAGSVARSAVAAAGLPGPTVVAIGEPSAHASRELGLEVLAVAATPDAGGVIDAVLTTLGA